VKAPPQAQRTAKQLLKQGDTDGALHLYEKLLADRPRDASLWFGKAEVLRLRGRRDAAIAAYDRALAIEPANPLGWSEKGDLLLEAGRLAEAREAFRHCVRRDPNTAGDLMAQAGRLRRDGHADWARVVAQAVLDAQPENVAAWVTMGDALAGLDDPGGAERWYKRSLEREPKNARALSAMGIAMNRRGRWGAAIQSFNRAIAIEWNAVEPWLHKGLVLLEHGTPEEAIECFQKVLQFDNRNVAAWVGKGRAHAERDDREAAESCLRRALELDPGNADAKALLAPSKSAKSEEPEINLPADLGAFAEALESAQSGEDEDRLILLELADLALASGDPHMALVRYTQALAENGQSTEAWCGKGIALQRIGRFDEAVVAFDRALALKPGHKRATRGREASLRHVRQ